MDKKYKGFSGNTIAVSGFGYEASGDALSLLRLGQRPSGKAVLSHDADVSVFLKTPKTRKFLSKQDRLALVAAGKAIKSAGLTSKALDESVAVFMTVGYIPFDITEARELAESAVRDGVFSMEEFTVRGYAVVNPIRAFSCLPNMPAHHLSANYGMHGEYFVTYPGAAQFYETLSEAVFRLTEGSIEAALIGAVADQSNFLVENHYRKANGGRVPPLADSAAFFILEKTEAILGRGAKSLASLDSFEVCPAKGQSGEESAATFGCVDVPLGVSVFIEGREDTYEHRLVVDGCSYASRWRRS